MSQLPWSLEMSGLYQNFDVSCTNFTASVLQPESAAEIKGLRLLSDHTIKRPVRFGGGGHDLLPDPGDGAPLRALRESGVMGEGKGRLRLLPLRGLENPLRDGEWARSSLLPLPRLFSGSRGAGALGPPPRLRLSSPSTASSRLCSRPPFPSNNKDKSVLSVSLCNPRPPLRPLTAPRGELLASGVLAERGGGD